MKRPSVTCNYVTVTAMEIIKLIYANNHWEKRFCLVINDQISMAADDSTARVIGRQMTMLSGDIAFDFNYQ